MSARLALEVEPGTHGAPIQRVLVGGHAGMFCTVGADRRLRVWQDGDPSPSRTLLTPRGPGQVGEIRAATLHPVDPVALIALRGEDGGSRLWAYHIELDEVTEIAEMLSYPSTRAIDALAFDPSGEWLFVADDIELRAYGPDGSTGDEEETEVAGPTVSIELPSQVLDLAVAELGDGTLRLFVLRRGQPQPTVYDLVDAGFVVRQDDSTGPWSDSVDVRWQGQVATGGDHVAVAGADRVVVYDLDGGAGRPVPLDASVRPASVALSPDGWTLVVGSAGGSDSEATVHSVGDGLSIVGRRSFDDDVLAVAALDDEVMVAAGGRRKTVRAWSRRLATEAEARELGGDFVVKGVAEGSGSVGIQNGMVGLGPAGPPAPSAELGPLTRAFDLDFFQVLSDPSEHESGGLDGQHRRIHDRDGLELQVVGGWLLLDRTGRDGPDADPIELLQGPEVFSIIGQGHVAAVDLDGALWIIEPEPGDGGGAPVAPSRRLVSRDCRATDLAAGDRWLVTAGIDHVVRLWFLDDVLDRLSGDQDDGSEVAAALRLFVSAEPEVAQEAESDLEHDEWASWVLWSACGYYAACPGGGRHLIHLEDQGPELPPLPIGADQLFRQLYDPTLIDAIIALGSEERALAQIGYGEGLVADALPPELEGVRITRALDAEGDDVAIVGFTVVENEGHPADRVMVLLDGIPQWELDGDVGGHHEVEIWLPPVDNRLVQIVAENGVGRSAPVQRPVPVPGSGPTDSTGELPPPAVASVSWNDDPDVGGDGPVGVIGGPGSEHQPIIIVDLDPTPIADGVDPGFVPSAVSGVRVTGGAINLSLAVDVDDETELLATRNDTELWRAQLGPGVAMELSVDLAAIDGENRMEVSASTATSGPVRLFDASVEASVEDQGIDPLAVTQAPLAEPGRLERRRSTTPPIDNRTHSQAQPQDRPESVVHDRASVQEQPDPIEVDPVLPDGRPQLFLLAVGVDDLADNDDFDANRDQGRRRPLGDLRYAVADARAVAQALTDDSTAFAPGGWQAVLADDDATTGGIEEALAQLQAALGQRAIEKRQRRLAVRDVVVFFFAGHGVTRTQPTGDGEQLYLVTHDYDRDDVPASCLSMRKVGRALSSLPAEVIVMIDACRSGATVPSEWRPSNAAEVGNELGSGRESALYVITASTSKEVAWEDHLAVPYRSPAPGRSTVGHGMFTHGILKKLEPVNDEAITLYELIGGVGKYVQEWTSAATWARRQRRRQTPTTYIDQARSIAAGNITIFEPARSGRNTR